MNVLLQAADQLGAGLVLATHDATVAERLDAIWKMHDGELVITS
ncbi:hypothetical protein [Nocardioides panaciterrulae]|uniref:Putative ABC-type transport system involved in lysophospholipase L1 biosynthesis ATPase subunit n=1 Tax=Nocardioides panaciterrulae TaxID=661492 RepID=A0A7Y9E873_9ACTN|nr:hypothetical protein [Nocardioides panaciterrulae]NYD42646.1 putative ABC-type transport system involved in lysophospholipase L1 biosynthesis ATPase subunit [Nocardioides panaciterrulae]